MQRLNCSYFFCGLFLLVQPAAAQSEMDRYSAGSCLEEQVDEAWVEGAEFIMGEDSTYKEEGPAHAVSVSGFWIDTHEVTNAQFAKFAEEMAYITVAEKNPDPAGFRFVCPAGCRPACTKFVVLGGGN